MYCGNCGHQLPDGSKFCENCGARVDLDQPKSKRSSKKPLIAAVIVVVILAVGLIGYNTVGLAMKKSQMASQIDKSKIAEYIGKKDKMLDEWDLLGIADLTEKKTMLHQLEDICDNIDDFEECKREIQTMESEKENYNLDADSYNAYLEVLDDCQTAIDELRATDALENYAAAQSALEELVRANDTYIEERMELYESLDLSSADQDVTDGYEKNLKEIEALGESDNVNYSAYKTAFANMDETIYMYIDPEKELNVSVQQIDASEFPKVKLYLSVQDTASGEVPSDLESSFFYINKEDANAEYVKQVVSDVGQLDESEALKIDMVADVSGSMEGSPLAEAKAIMSNFVNSVQFEAGDMVELTSFATGVRLEEEFTDDADLLIEDINRLYTGDMTSLYDALYTAVGRVAAQTGARCVIAFTDGNDNYSSCSANDVIMMANRYHIPVFIIGIGNIDASSMTQIANQTGGAYYSIADVYSMQSIYDEIYRMEKELYLLEYEDSSGADITDTAHIQVGYRSLHYGGECEYSYTPNTLISVNASTLYTDGPEAVVEKYMKNFDDAMTNSDFSYIEDCLLAGSSIYTEQQAYVQKGITEMLDSYEIVSTDYSDSNNCVVTTRETYYVQKPNKPLQLMTQQCRYSVTKNGDSWKMTAFAGKVEVLSRINQ